MSNVLDQLTYDPIGSVGRLVKYIGDSTLDI